MRTTTAETTSRGYLQVVAARAAENVPLVARRVELTADETEAFEATEAVCAAIAAGKRS